MPLDDGGTYSPSAMQRKIKGYWDEFHAWVPTITKGEPHILVVNGDAVEGIHHGSVTQVSHNMEDQLRIARTLLAPEIAKAAGGYLHVRGTEAHVGPSAQYEERLARELGATPNDEGQHARWDLWLEVGGGLVHFLHHVGTTGSAAYEATAVHRELTESFVEAGRWGDRPPNMIVRSHRHRYIEIRIASDMGRATAVVTPAFQGKTPFTWRIPGARISQPQFGGIVICVGEDGLYVREKVWRIERPRPVVI